MDWLNNIIAYVSTGDTADELQRKSDELDRQRQELNKKKRDEYADLYGDVFAEQWYADTKENDALSVQHVQDDISAGFNEGLAQGAQNVAKFGKDTAGFTWKVIPWWAWLLIVLVVVMYFGLGRNLFARAK